MKIVQIVLVLLCLQGRFVWAQTGPYDESPQAAPVAMRPVSEDKWREASGTLNYSDDRFKEKKKKEPTVTPDYTPSARDWTQITGFWGNVFQVLAIILAVAGIAFGIYKMLQQPRNKALARDGVEITLDNLEEYLHETDLDRFLRTALAEKNYALAIRLYYLQIIKDLSTKGAISWSREKTNRDYLREMRQHPLSEPFRTATRTFERVWYGNLPLDETLFKSLEPDFKRFF